MRKQTIHYGADIEWMPPQLAEAHTYQHVDPHPFLAQYEGVLQRLGTKYSPTVHKVGQFHNDTVFTEGAIPLARSTDDLLAKAVRLHTYLEAFTGMQLRGYDHIIMPEYDIKKLPYLHAEASHMGCAPDMYNGEVRTIPDEVRLQPFKESGFHIHFDLPPSVCAGFVHTAAPSGATVMVDTGPVARQVVADLADALTPYHCSAPDGFTQWYRRPGTYRIKPYGIEYRALGAGIWNDIDRLTGMLAIVDHFVKGVWRALS